MAVIEPVAVEVLGSGAVRVTFSGTGYIYVDGLFAAGPVAGSADLNVPDCFAIEVHDGDYGPIVTAPRTRPMISWRPVPGEAPQAYRVYISQEGSESLALAEPYDPEVTAYAVQSPSELAEGWALIRVESVDAYGNETTVDAWPIRIFDIPDAPADIAVTGTAGVFDITVT